MTLDQLRIFVAVAELQHVTRAAASLHLTQSTVSSAIRSLEARHDVVLFNRVGRRIELTAEGSVFLESARAVLAQARNAETMLADLGGVRRGVLAVFASQTIANFWLPSRLVAYSGRYPLVELRIRIGNTAESVAAVCEGSADLGLIEGEAAGPWLHMDLVARDKLVLVVGAGHPWSSRPPRLPAELFQTRWAMREAGSGTRSSFEHAIQQFGLAPKDIPVAMELPSNEALCAAVAAGSLAAVVSASVAQAGVEAGRLVIIPLDIGTREFRLIRHKERKLSRAGLAFIQMLGDLPQENAASRRRTSGH